MARWLRALLGLLALGVSGLGLGQQVRIIVVTHGQAADPF
jgi:hypothetical protein